MSFHELQNFWSGKKIFITGHTGFKGSWLCIALKELGAVISGYSLPLSKKNKLFIDDKIEQKIKKSYYGYIRNYEKLKKIINYEKPEIMIHMAAQPMVGESYINPKYTYEVNTLGTLNILNIIKMTNFIKTSLIVTTDKVYKNLEISTPYKETSQLGGDDPYSSSKACAELIVHSYIKSFFKKNKKKIVMTARAGNVIGGGDYSKNRIIPDYIECMNKKKKLILRQPNSIRPWQHVIEPLTGYLILIQKISKIKNLKNNYNWNFGPNQKNNQPVINIINLLNKYSDYCVKTKFLTKKSYHETNILKLNSAKSQKYLGWKGLLTIEETLYLIINWYKSLKKTKNTYQICKDQIFNYLQQIK